MCTSRSDFQKTTIFRNATVFDFESNFLDLEIKAKREAASVVGQEKRGIALKHCCASAVK